MPVVPLLQAAEEAPKGPFAINPGVSIWTLVVFLLLLGALAKWVWPMILKAVEEREKRIAAQIEAAEKANRDAQQVLADYRQKLAAAHGEAQELLAAGKQAAEKAREEILARARAEHEDLIGRARREIAAEREKALAELRGEAVELSLAAASKVLEKNLDSEADRRLVREYLNSLHDTAT
ncbi:MAG TPA: F0F1 ATP synthase subunit B [Gemmatimonadales bacterium]|nr:F0F1 ATP synthase subunit B [Gemmatimonadales bacterium]